eukprot:4767206-Amphidinium_carterae.1
MSDVSSSYSGCSHGTHPKGCRMLLHPHIAHISVCVSRQTPNNNISWVWLLVAAELLLSLARFQHSLSDYVDFVG